MTLTPDQLFDISAIRDRNEARKQLLADLPILPEEDTAEKDIDVLLQLIEELQQQ
jgi:hypothetical protein